jgi:hypothetical protein
MLTIPVAPVGETRSREKEFLELVYADEELLRAEFDAIVAEEWPTDGPPGRPRATSRGTGPSPARQAERPGLRAPAGKAPHPLGRLPGRQRSPPASEPGHRPHPSPDEPRHTKAGDHRKRSTRD